MNKTFYTIMDGEGNFMNANLYRKNNDNIYEAIRFSHLEDVEDYFGELRKDKGFKIVRVKCELEDVEDERLENLIHDYYIDKFNEYPTETKVKTTAILLPYKLKLLIYQHGINDTKVREKIFEFISR